MARARQSAIILGLLLGAGCGSPFSPGDLRDWAGARARWASRPLPDYEFDITISCFCPVELAQRTRVVVVGDRVIRARAAGATADHPAEYLQFWPTLDDLFVRIRSASEASGVDRITARYDRILGFPAFLSIDYDSSIQDAGATYQVSDVRLIGGTGALPVRPD